MKQINNPNTANENVAMDNVPSSLRTPADVANENIPYVEVSEILEPEKGTIFGNCDSDHRQDVMPEAPADNYGCRTRSITTRFSVISASATDKLCNRLRSKIPTALNQLYPGKSPRRVNQKRGHMQDALSDLLVILTELKIRGGTDPEMAVAEATSLMDAALHSTGSNLGKYWSTKEDYISAFSHALFLAEWHNCGTEKIAEHVQKYFSAIV